MPKKRHFKFNQLQNSSSQASYSNNVEPASPSVNDRLAELRRLETRDALAKKRLLADSVNQRSVPPEAQRILGIQESAPPKPKREPNARARERLRGTPGPAAPRSWLNGSGGNATEGLSGSLVLRGGKGGKGLRKLEANHSDRVRPKHLLRFAKLAGREDGEAVDGKPSKLSHLALKTIAQLWDAFDEDDYPALVEIPLGLRVRMLAYISFYGPALDYADVRALLQGTEGLTDLDLAGLVGHHGLSLRKLQKLSEQDQKASHRQSVETVVESWDAEESPAATLLPSLSASRFSTLTHLCLSHPNPINASWKDLLAFSKHTPQVTHLSLAYWPRPTLTPNLATATISTPSLQQISAGGSHYYSHMDNDMEEPASLLRQLSTHLLCLQWLDLEGCSTWISAFKRLASEVPRDGGFEVDELGPSNTVTDPSKPLSIFSSTWKNLSYIRCAQAQMPTEQCLTACISTGHIARDSLEGRLVMRAAGHPETRSTPFVELPRETVGNEMRRAAMWVNQEMAALEAAWSVNGVRRLARQAYITWDLGWKQISWAQRSF